MAGTDEPPPDPRVDERITREQAAERLGVSLATVDRYAAGRTPRLNRQRNAITRRVTFSAAEVEALRREREQ